MVASGSDTDNEESFVYKVEVIDLLNSSRTCKEWAEIPDDFGRFLALGGLVEEGLLMCYGSNDHFYATDCLHITKNSTVKTPVSFDVGLFDPNSRVLAVLDNNKLFISGGYGRIFLVNCLVQPLILFFLLYLN